MSQIAVIILAAGQGQRMKSARPKVMHEIGARAMIAHVIDAAKALAPDRICVVIGEHSREAGAYATAIDPDIKIAMQSPPQGTGDAVKQALAHLEDFAGAALVLYADTPLVRPQTLAALAGEITKGAALAVLGFSPADPGAYGRLKKDASGSLSAIVEAKDASPEELAIGLCNSGVMAINSDFLKTRIGDLDADNAKKEYYLTDLAALARADGKPCAVIETDAEEVLGVNSRAELAAAERVFQNRMRRRAMDEGATLQDPASVYFSFDTALGRDVFIGPNVVFGPGVRLADNVVVHAFSHIEGATIAAGAVIGPFARLRPGANVGESAKIGNFVEVKNADIAAGAKINHLSYVGDAEIGKGANIGAGTITCNYDGFGKYKTLVGEKAFIGSNSSLVAPVSIGAGAYVGSGSVITKNVEPDALAVARGRQADIKGWAARFRKIQKNDKK